MNNAVITFLASFLIFILFGGLVVLWVIDGKIKKEQVLHALFACLFAWVIAYFIKEFFPTARPYLLNGSSTLTLTVPKDSAFPSQHTTIAFALAVTIFLHDRKIGWLFLFCALLIGVARVMANVHYPVDILGGAFLGTLVSILVDKTHFFKVNRS